MKKILYLFGLLFIVSLFFTSCTKEEDENAFWGLETKGAVALTSNVVNGFFDLANPDASSIAFDIDTKGEAVSSLAITKNVNGSGENDFSTLTSFPATIAVEFNEALAGTGVSVSDLEPGDKAVFSFYVTTATGTYPGGTLSIDMSCVSDLAGTFDYSTVGWCGDSHTGVTAWEDAGAGAYNVVNPDDPTNPSVADFSYGAYDACYGPGGAFPEGDLQVLDVCGLIAPTGASQWGEVYWFNNVTVNGAELTIDWENDYGEAGVTTLTRQDSNDWPPLTHE